jgi:hypothetical protein
MAHGLDLVETEQAAAPAASAADRVIAVVNDLVVRVSSVALPCDPPVGAMPMQWRGQYHALIVRSAMCFRVESVLIRERSLPGRGSTYTLC